jgi:hypothetical protein
VVQPDGRTPPEAIRNFFEFQQEKNNVLILSGHDSHLANEVEARLRELYAVERIHAKLKPGDTLFEEARDKLEELSERFTKAVSGAYNRLFFPGGDGELVMATIDNGLSFGEGEHSAEAQIEKLLASGRCDNKLALDMTDELPNYWAMAETYLWPAKDRRVPWRDLVMRAKTDPTWPWMPGARGWRCCATRPSSRAVGARPPRATSRRDPSRPRRPRSTSPRSAPIARPARPALAHPAQCRRQPARLCPEDAAVSEQDEQVQDLEDYRTTGGDPLLHRRRQHRQIRDRPSRPAGPRTSRHPPRDHKRRRQPQGRAALHPACRDALYPRRHQPQGGHRLHRTLPGAARGCTILIAAKAGEVEKSAKIQIPADGDDRVIIDDTQAGTARRVQAGLHRHHRQGVRFIQRFKDRPDTLLRGVQIILGEGENAVQIRFNERELTPPPSRPPSAASARPWGTSRPRSRS